MTDETGLPTPEPPTVPPVAPEPPMAPPVTPAEAPDASGPRAGDAWDDVMARMNDLGDAVMNWAKAATNDPSARQKLDQFRGGINDIGQKADAAFGPGSDFGQHVKGGAEQAGAAFNDAAQQVTQAAAPHMRNAFTVIAEAFGKAAAKMDEVAQSREEPAAPATPDVPAAPTVEPAEPVDPGMPGVPVEPVERGSGGRP